MTNIKKLTGAELKKQNKVLDEQREFSVMIGDTEYKLTHDVTFRKTKQSRLLEDVIAFFTAGVNRPEILEISTVYSTLLILKHFTSLEVSDDIGEALELLDVLVDLEVLDKIVNELPEDEITKIYELLTKTVNNMETSIVEAEEEAKKLANQVENKEIKDMIDNG